MIVIATPQAGTPAVDLLVAAMPAGTTKVRIWRSFAGYRTVIRDADGAPTGGSTSRPYADFDAPLSQPVTYQAYAYSAASAVLASAESAAVTVTSTSPWISDPLAPGRGCPVRLVNESLQEISHDVQGDIAQVIESGLPIAVLGAVGVASEVPLRFSARTAEEGAKIREVLQTPIFLLRLPPELHYQVPALAYIAFQKYSDIKVRGEHDHIALSGVVVAPPLSQVVLAPRTCGDLRDEASTCGDVQNMYPTCLDALRGSVSG